MSPVQILKRFLLLGGLFFGFFLFLFFLSAKNSPVFAQYCDPTCYDCGIFNECGDYCGDCPVPTPTLAPIPTPTPWPGYENCGQSGTCPDGQTPIYKMCTPSCGAIPQQCQDTSCEIPWNCVAQGGCPDSTPHCAISGCGVVECGPDGSCYSNCDACGGGGGDTHLECVGAGICGVIFGSGSNECSSGSDCGAGPTPTPIPAPGVCPTSWAAVGTFNVGCNTTISANFPATMVKFTMTSGGGGDNRISFYDGGSNGASWTTSDGGVYQVTNRSAALTVGESRWTNYFGPKTVTQHNFSVGCPDGERMDAAVERCLPPPTGTITCNPSNMTLPPGSLGTSTISSTWQNFISGYPSADICVSNSGDGFLAKSLFTAGGGPNGSDTSNATWIQAGYTYRFTLFNLPTDSSPRCSGTAIAFCTVTATTPPAPLCTISGSTTIPLGDSGIYSTTVNVPAGGDANAEIDVNTSQLVTGLTRLAYSDCGDTENSCYVNTTWTPTAVGTYYVFCRGYNDGLRECRPFPPYTYPADVDCDPPDGVPDDPPIGNDFITVTVTPPGPWFQAKGGDVHGQNGISSPIPGTLLTDKLFSLDLDGYPGVVSYGGGSAYFGQQGEVSSKGWLAESSLTLAKSSYDYFYQKLDSPNVDNFSCDPSCPAPSPGQTTIYYSSDNVNIDGINSWAIPANTKVVVLINGDLNISLNLNRRITVPVGSFLAFIVKGNIDIDGNVGNKEAGYGVTPFLQGVYLADGVIDTYQPDPADPGLGSGFRLVGAGLFYGKGGVNLQRDLKDDCTGICNATTPSELFLFRPDLVLNAPKELWFSKISWVEVAP